MNNRISRRRIVQAGAALGASAIFSPPILAFAQGETSIKVGMHDPLTGTYAAEGESEVRGAHMALAEINAKGGMLGREGRPRRRGRCGKRRHGGTEGAQADRTGQGVIADGRSVVRDGAIRQPGRP